ncbi:LLM class flavin-dependent oxidoreductase [Corynebacterium kroppenstedtii]|uniref:LLM class flavin-dependent oxidoreductase n=1 Tax=Corynebacterium pseudokroppenstedtii TaxID=2804917 RepID=UPI00194EC22C|nr:LLM class flavin-dependent oxidoreductase [Corynebacterium pseudokroppenstedtii]MCF6793579.1 LLM class flavin-dependent oxidoreductase [Corynebacterium pseudokroppenstedtii]MDK7148184.1 LLM class flavin-dependent oxidoreductase [Corynebacterium pseudokroppenstedtii]MDU6478447.1 LLM class flavin-dependent oxidoreductase [Corynebacterium kroppenstedtii]QRP14477.1 LLM class flavin-dependent oxidoreductase [Corynebacterium kroppenstedtii]
MVNPDSPSSGQVTSDTSTTDLSNIELGLLDLVPVSEGMTMSDALHATIRSAQAAERAGYDRFWLAEHHNSKSLASSATTIMIGQVAAATHSISVGAGGVMLPNHAPLHVAEEFGTLDALYPGRIELGLGRAPGTDPMTAQALRRGKSDVPDFEHDLAELRRYMGPMAHRVNAFPGLRSHVPFYMLGSSENGAMIAAHAGLPFVFASHFAPFRLSTALETYRNNFVAGAYGDRADGSTADADSADGGVGSNAARSSAVSGSSLSKPHVTVGVNVMVAETEEKARHLFTTHEQSFYGIVTGTRGLFRPPKDVRDGNVMAWQQVDAALQVNAVGTPDQVKDKIARIVQATEAQGVIASIYAFEVEDRLRAIEMLGEALRS